MDWNKTKTILIISFIILNIFLFTSSYKDVISNEYNVVSDLEFIVGVKNILKEKDILINVDLPDESYMLPTLDTEYEIIEINNDLLNGFLGPGVEPLEGITLYSNEKGETLEVALGKKLNYTVREKSSEKFNGEEAIEENIYKFIEEKKIDVSGYTENYRHISEFESFVVYTKKYNNFSMDNSYMIFYLDKIGIFKFEMQNIVSVKETAEKIRTFSAVEALPRLLSFKDISNKEIISIEMTFFSVEDENWKYISRINSYPVWKVIFNDGTQKHLSSVNTNNFD